MGGKRRYHYRVRNLEGKIWDTQHSSVTPLLIVNEEVRPGATQKICGILNIFDFSMKRYEKVRMRTNDERS